MARRKSTSVTNHVARLATSHETADSVANCKTIGIRAAWSVPLSIGELYIHSATMDVKWRDPERRRKGSASKALVVVPTNPYST